MRERRSRDIILEALRSSGTASGQRLAEAAGISRTAVWKHIKALRREGYAIESVTGSGYTLLAMPQGLTAREIAAGLEGSLFARRLVCLAEVDSTQRVAAEMVRQGCPEGTVVLAERQASGRGRVRRPWVSLPQSLALSAVFRPSVPPGEASLFPLLAGVSCARAVAEIAGVSPGLKWPNDLLLNGRKVGGILAEMHGELDRLEALILGLGCNLNTAAEDFPEELRKTATSVRLASGRPVDPVRMVQGLLRSLEEDYGELRVRGGAWLIERWKALSTTLGRRVTVHRPGEDLAGTALDLDPQGALLVETASGLITVQAGDLSLREGAGPSS